VNANKQTQKQTVFCLRALFLWTRAFVEGTIDKIRLEVVPEADDSKLLFARCPVCRFVSEKSYKKQCYNRSPHEVEKLEKTASALLLKTV
jgi:hypothetical protein